LKEYIGKDTVPVFYLKRRDKIITNNDDGVSKGIRVSNFNKCKVSIDFFPSRTEIYTLLDNFLEARGIKKDYDADNKGTGVEISFIDSDVAYDFVKFMNYEKISNPLYKKIRTNMVFDSKQNKMADKRKKNHQSNKSLNMSNNVRSKIHSYTENHKMLKDQHDLNISSGSHGKSQVLNFETDHNNINLTPARKISNNRNVVIPFHNKGKSMELNTRKFLEDNERGKSLRISQPYVPQNDSQILAYKDNKEKWINKKGYVPVLGKLKQENVPKGVINYDIPYRKHSNHNFRDYYGTEVMLDESKFYKYN